MGLSILLTVSVLPRVYSVAGTCSDDLVLERISMCANKTGFDETHCENLDCYLVCVESLLVECQQIPEFYYHDPVVFKVKQRAVCHYKEYHTQALEACQIGVVCTADVQQRLQAVFQNSLYHRSSGDFDAYRDASCTLHSLMKACFQVVVNDDCSETMAEYMNDFNDLGHSQSACQDPQDTPLFAQFGVQLNCTTSANEEFDPNVTLSFLRETATTAITTYSVGVTSVNSYTSTKLLAEFTTPSRAVQFSSTTTEEPRPASCMPLSMSFRALLIGCTDLIISFTTVEETKERCKDMDCKLVCYDDVIQDCDTYDPFYSKIANRLYTRFVCNKTASGEIDDVRRSDCYMTACFEEYEALLANETDYVKYCRYFEELQNQTCNFFLVTDLCTQSAADFFTTEYLLGWDFCQLEASPFYEAYNNSDYQCLRSYARGLRCDELIVCNAFVIILLFRLTVFVSDL